MATGYFRVDGADLETGEESYVILQAPSAAEAELVARKQGLLIAAVRVASSQDWGVARGSKTAIPPARAMERVIRFESPQSRSSVATISEEPALAPDELIALKDPEVFSSPARNGSPTEEVIPTDFTPIVPAMPTPAAEVAAEPELVETPADIPEIEAAPPTDAVAPDLIDQVSIIPEIGLNAPVSEVAPSEDLAPEPSLIEIESTGPAETEPFEVSEIAPAAHAANEPLELMEFAPASQPESEPLELVEFESSEQIDGDAIETAATAPVEIEPINFLDTEPAVVADSTTSEPKEIDLAITGEPTGHAEIEPFDLLDTEQAVQRENAPIEPTEMNLAASVEIEPLEFVEPEPTALAEIEPLELINIGNEPAEQAENTASGTTALNPADLEMAPLDSAEPEQTAQPEVEPFELIDSEPAVQVDGTANQPQEIGLDVTAESETLEMIEPPPAAPMEVDPFELIYSEPAALTEIALNEANELDLAITAEIAPLGSAEPEPAELTEVEPFELIDTEPAIHTDSAASENNEMDLPAAAEVMPPEFVEPEPVAMAEVEPFALIDADAAMQVDTAQVEHNVIEPVGHLEPESAEPQKPDSTSELELDLFELLDFEPSAQADDKPAEPKQIEPVATTEAELPTVFETKESGQAIVDALDSLNLEATAQADEAPIESMEISPTAAAETEPTSVAGINPDESANPDQTALTEIETFALNEFEPVPQSDSVPGDHGSIELTTPVGLESTAHVETHTGEPHDAGSSATTEPDPFELMEIESSAPTPAEIDPFELMLADPPTAEIEPAVLVAIEPIAPFESDTIEPNQTEPIAQIETDPLEPEEIAAIAEEAMTAPSSAESSPEVSQPSEIVATFADVPAPMPEAISQASNELPSQIHHTTVLETESTQIPPPSPKNEPAESVSASFHPRSIEQIAVAPQMKSELPSPTPLVFTNPALTRPSEVVPQKPVSAESLGGSQRITAPRPSVFADAVLSPQAAFWVASRPQAPVPTSGYQSVQAPAAPKPQPAPPNTFQVTATGGSFGRLPAANPPLPAAASVPPAPVRQQGPLVVMPTISQVIRSIKSQIPDSATGATITMLPPRGDPSSQANVTRVVAKQVAPQKMGLAENLRRVGEMSNPQRGTAAGFPNPFQQPPATGLPQGGRPTITIDPVKRTATLHRGPDMSMPPTVLPASNIPFSTGAPVQLPAVTPAKQTATVAANSPSVEIPASTPSATIKNVEGEASAAKASGVSPATSLSTSEVPIQPPSAASAATSSTPIKPTPKTISTTGKSAPVGSAARTKSPGSKPSPTKKKIAPGSRVPSRAGGRGTPAAASNNASVPKRIAQYVLTSLAVLAALGGIGVIIAALIALPPSGATELQKLNFRMEVRTEELIGAVIFVTGLLCGVTAAFLRVSNAKIQKLPPHR